MSIPDQFYPLPRVHGCFQPVSPGYPQAVAATTPTMVKGWNQCDSTIACHTSIHRAELEIGNKLLVFTYKLVPTYAIQNKFWVKMKLCIILVTLLMFTGAGIKTTGVVGIKGPIKSCFPSSWFKMYFWHGSTFSFTFGSRASEHAVKPGGGKKRNSPCCPPKRKRILISKKDKQWRTKVTGGKRGNASHMKNVLH